MSEIQPKEKKAKKQVLVKGKKVKVPPTPEEIRAGIQADLAESKEHLQTLQGELAELTTEFSKMSHLNLIEITKMVLDEMDGTKDGIAETERQIKEYQNILDGVPNVV